MPSGELLTQAGALAGSASSTAREAAATIPALQEWIVAHFGENGLYASYLVAAALGLFILSQIVRMTFAALKYLVVPGIGLALIGSFILPYSFLFLLPITVAACSVLLLFKG